MKSLWGGRFSGPRDDFFAAYNDSLRFDLRLAEVDIVGSKAYARALSRSGIFSASELTEVLAGLDTLEHRIQTDEDWASDAARAGYEDVHAFVEMELTKLTGDLGKKLHTGRSRNDQVATDLRLYLRAAVDHTIAGIKALQIALTAQAEQHRTAVMPGYTHLQKAQPILFAHYMLSYCEMLKRDAARLQDARRRINIMPLGSGALAGNSLSIDRLALAKDLGFDGITANSLDATSDRDFVLEYLSAAAVSMMHLSRLSEDLILYSTDEFRFIRLGDQVSTGSSLMPQKKNPDALELIRGKSGRVYGHLMGMLTVMKGLPSCYNKDMQEDKEAVFDTIDTWGSSLRVMTLVIDTMAVQAETMGRHAMRGYMNATDLADYFVENGVPFREAHHLVGRIVTYASSKDVSLNDLSLLEYQEFFPAADDKIYSAVALENVLQKKGSLGGTAPDRVQTALEVTMRDLHS